ncbi:MAG TPA: DUF308 domain-containing protein [Candidatus Baltobacteraceae bacterium]
MIAPAIARLARFWWLLGLRGLLGVMFGVAALVWPGVTLAVLILFFGAYMFVDGAFALIAAIRFRHEREHWVMLLLEGLLGIAIGTITFLWPGLTALAWVYTIAAWAIVTGILELTSAFLLRRTLGPEIVLGLGGIVSIVFGIAMAALPLIGLFVWVIMTGAYAIAFGILLLVAAIRMRRVAKSPVAASV